MRECPKHGRKRLRVQVQEFKDFIITDNKAILDDEAELGITTVTYYCMAIEEEFGTCCYWNHEEALNRDEWLALKAELEEPNA